MLGSTFLKDEGTGQMTQTITITMINLGSGALLALSGPKSSYEGADKSLA
jgi:hypothetical protein